MPQVEAPRVPVERLADGSFALHLDDGERRVLASLVQQLQAATSDGPDLDDPAFARLYPTVMPDDPARSAAYVDLVHADLEAGRREALETVAATLDATVVDGTQAAAWLGVCNDLRLVMGTRLGIAAEDEDEDGDDAGDDDPDHPDAFARMVFHYLGWLVGAFVDALEPGLPDPEH
jgi:hypothetical protein